jgi:RNA polymerase sigma-70 factor (ECF subfamily)
VAHAGDAPTGDAADWQSDVAAWLRGRDEAAARRLMAALYPQVISIIRTRLPRRTDAEDLAQEVFVKFFERLGSYNGRAPLPHWVSRIAVNVCLDALRAEKRRPELRWADLSETQAQVLDATLMLEPINSINASDAGELAEKLLETLSPEERQVIQMLDLEGRTSVEVEALTGWSAVAIRVRAFRARRKLRKTMLKLERTKT